MLARAELGFAPRNADGEKCLELLVAKLRSFVGSLNRSLTLARLKSTGRAFAARMSSSAADPSLPNYCVYCDRQFESAELF
jgi:hypothetical protein